LAALIGLPNANEAFSKGRDVRVAAWEDSAVTMLNVGARSPADLQAAAELVLG